MADKMTDRQPMPSPAEKPTKITEANDAPVKDISRREPRDADGTGWTPPQAPGKPRPAPGRLPGDTTGQPGYAPPVRGNQKIEREPDAPRPVQKTDGNKNPFGV